VDGGAVPV
jgi:hypothetical protein